MIKETMIKNHDKTMINVRVSRAEEGTMIKGHHLQRECFKSLLGGGAGGQVDADLRRRDPLSGAPRSAGCPGSARVSAFCWPLLAHLGPFWLLAAQNRIRTPFFGLRDTLVSSQNFPLFSHFVPV